MMIMDDTAQSSLQNSTQGDDGATQAPQPQVVPQPVGSVAKEHGPLGTSEFIAPSGAEIEPVIPEEVAEHGVEAVASTEAPPLTATHKEAGIQHAKESVPVSSQPQGTIQLPMTEEDALHTIKTTKIFDSKHWLAVLIEKVYQKLRFMHQTLTK